VVAALIIDAHLRDWLAQATGAALDLSHRVPVQLMRHLAICGRAVLFDCIVAKSAPEGLATTWSHQFAATSVVLASPVSFLL
jgi:formate dehydrogenase assembly factor FdhD